MCNVEVHLNGFTVWLIENNGHNRFALTNIQNGNSGRKITADILVEKERQYYQLAWKRDPCKPCSAWCNVWVPHAQRHTLKLVATGYMVKERAGTQEGVAQPVLGQAATWTKSSLRTPTFSIAKHFNKSVPHGVVRLYIHLQVGVEYVNEIDPNVIHEESEPDVVFEFRFFDGRDNDVNLPRTPSNVSRSNPRNTFSGISKSCNEGQKASSRRLRPAQSSSSANRHKNASSGPSTAIYRNGSSSESPVTSRLRQLRKERAISNGSESDHLDDFEEGPDEIGELLAELQEERAKRHELGEKLKEQIRAVKKENKRITDVIAGADIEAYERS